MNRPSKVAKTREQQVAERRQSVLEAAVRAIASKGLTNLTIRDIAKEADCSYGVVSFHYESKDGVVLACLEQLISDYDNALARLSAENPSPRMRLLRMIEIDFDPQASSLAHLAVWVAFWAETPRVPTFRTRCIEIKETYHRYVRQAVSELAKERSLDVDADRVARGLNAMIDGFWVMNLVDGRLDEDRLKEAVQCCHDFLSGYFPQDF